MAEVHEDKSLAARRKFYAVSAQASPRALVPPMCFVFRFPNTKDALSSVQKTFLFFIFCAQRGREAGAFHVRKTSPEDFTRDN
jgi:hypothetical protein